MDGIFGQTTQATEYGYEIRIMECKEFVKGGIPEDSFEGTIQI
jgi:hypothetical protein